jgi:hypothetical protein
MPRLKKVQSYISTPSLGLHSLFQDNLFLTVKSIYHLLDLEYPFKSIHEIFYIGTNTLIFAMHRKLSFLTENTPLSVRLDLVGSSLNSHEIFVF